MQRHDYIEKIAAFIVDGWDAADKGDQAACKAAKHSAMQIAARLPRTLAILPVIGSPSPNSARQTCIRPKLEETPPFQDVHLFTHMCSIKRELDDTDVHTGDLACRRKVVLG